MEKIKVSQDILYKYLQAHDFTLSVLNKRMGVSNGILVGCFNHDLNRVGKPMKFSAANIEKMNLALGQIADELRGCVLTFGSGRIEKSRGNEYDKSLAVTIRNGMGRYFKMKGLTWRLFRWTKAKSDSILSNSASPVFSNITRDIAATLNAELLSVAAVLGSYEIVSEDKEDNTNQ